MRGLTPSVLCLLAGACGGDPVARSSVPALEDRVEYESGVILALAFDATGERLACTSSNDRLRLRAISDGADLAVVRGHRRGITSVSFDPGGTRLVTGGYDRTVRVFGGEPLAEELVASDLDRPPLEVGWTAGGERFVAATMGGELLAWDATTGERVFSKPGPARGGVMALALSRDGSRLAWAADGGNLRVWSTGTGERLAIGRIDALGFVAAIALADDGERVAVAARDEPWLVIHDLASGTNVSCTPLDDPVRAVAFDPDGARVACATTSGEIALYDARNGSRLAMVTNEATAESPRRIAFGPCGNRLAAAGPGPLLRVWNVAGVRPLARGTPIAGATARGGLPRFEPEEGVLDLARLAVPGYDPPELRALGSPPMTLADFPEHVRALAGEEVRVRGYPIAADDEGRSFLLSRFPPGCCFGAVPVLDEWIQVRAPEGTPALPPARPVLVTGVLDVGERLDGSGYALSLYRMEARRVDSR